MKRLIIVYNFVLATLMTSVGFLSAQSPYDLVSAIVFFPLAVYMWVLIMPKRNISFTKAIDIQKKPKVSKTKTEAVVKTPLSKKAEPIKLKKIDQNVDDIDANRRMFIRLIGSAGIGVFFMSIVTRRAQAAFFGSAPGPGTINLKDTSGNQIDPAEKGPTDGYSISEIDDAGSPAYYGYVDKSGNWYIVKDDSGGFRYVRGASSFSTNWTNRAALSYGYFDAIF